MPRQLLQRPCEGKLQSLGTAPRGSKASNVQWLSAQIAEMEAINASNTHGSTATAKRRREAAAESGTQCARRKVARHTPAVGAPAAARSSDGCRDGDEQETVAALKEQYRALKGGPPRGKYANEATWLRSKIAEMTAARR